MAQNQQIDHYLLHEELGHGGMATVYRATDTQLQREVALKILHDHIAAQPDNRERFLREARAAARLSHPNILKIFGFSDPEHAVGYLAMEHIRGVNLRELNAPALREFPELAAALIWIVARALAAAHENHILHRDIKPENIMVDEHGRPRLMDFGLARMLDAHTMTATGTLMGSPAHMAPEIVEGKPYDERVDVFALGTVLYFVTTGRLPFEASNPAIVLHKIINGDYERARDLNPAIARELSQLTDEMLARDPARRIPTAAAVAERLERWLGELNIKDPESFFRAWYLERDAHLVALRPQLETAWLDRAAAAIQSGRAANPLALDHVNRALELNPQSERGARLLKQVSTNRIRYRVVQGVASGAAIAAAIALAIFLLSKLPAPSPPMLTLEELSLPTPDEVVGVADAEPEPTLDQDPPPPLDPASVAEANERIANAIGRAQLVATNRARTLARRERDRSPRNGASEAQEAPTPSAPTAGNEELFDVTIYVQPTAAEVYYRGERRCTGGGRCVLRLPAGVHEIVGRHPATSIEQRERVTVRQSGTEVRIRVPWRPAELVVEANRPGVVMFDGRRVGRTGAPIQIPVVGLRSTIEGTLRVVPDGDFGADVERRITISSGDVRRERVEF